MGAALRENTRRGAECALLGVLWTVFSLPVRGGLAMIVAALAAVALAVAGGVAVCLALLTFPQRIATRQPWPSCFMATASLAGARPWLVPLTAVHARALGCSPRQASTTSKEGKEGKRWPAVHL
jgi:hypothetical protein